MLPPDVQLVPTTVQGLESLVHDGSAVVYVTAASCVVLAWDTLLVLAREQALVWAAPPSLTKYAFLASHYGTLAALAVLAHASSTIALVPKTDQLCAPTIRVSPQTLRCQIALSGGLLLGIISIGISNHIVLLKVWRLWDQAAWVKGATIIFWAASYCATLALVVISLRELWPHIFSGAPFGVNMCAFLAVPRPMRGVWAAPLAFEMLVFVLTLWNALDRPRSAASPLSRELLRDGLAYFSVLFVLRVVNVVTIAALRPTLAFLGSPLIWALAIVTQNRLVLNQSVPLRSFLPRPPRLADEPRSPAPASEGWAFGARSKFEFDPPVPLGALPALPKNPDGMVDEEAGCIAGSRTGSLMGSTRAGSLAGSTACDHYTVEAL